MILHTVLLAVIFFFSSMFLCKIRQMVFNKESKWGVAVGLTKPPNESSVLVTLFHSRRVECKVLTCDDDESPKIDVLDTSTSRCHWSTVRELIAFLHALCNHVKQSNINIMRNPYAKLNLLHPSDTRSYFSSNYLLHLQNNAAGGFTAAQQRLKSQLNNKKSSLAH